MRADITLVKLAVIADRAHDVRRPIRRQPEFLTKIALSADKAAYRRLVRLQRVVNRLGADAELFRVDQRKRHPFDDVGPLRIVLADGEAKRLLGDDVRENHVVAGFGHL